MIRIILVRHGETDWNNQARFQGRIDVKLNKKGLEQAQAVAESLKNEKIEAIYSSPLERAIKTAELIATFHNLKPVVEPDLGEIDHGEWEGLSLEEVKKRYSSFYQNWFDHPESFKMPQGEGLKEIKVRIKPALKKILEGSSGETAVIVGHDAINKVIILELLGWRDSHFWQLKQGNGSISVLEYENGVARLTLLNNTCHLGGVIDTTTPGAL